MSKRQDKLHKQSLVEAEWYDSLSSDKKRAYTRPSIVSCKRVEKSEKDSYTVSECIYILQRKGAQITDFLIDFTLKGRRNEVIGHKTKARIAFLVKYHSFTCVGL